jgi:hypothetical protein
MKINFYLTYRGQTHTFKDIEFPELEEIDIEHNIDGSIDGEAWSIVFDDFASTYSCDAFSIKDEETFTGLDNQRCLAPTGQAAASKLP